MLTQFLENPMPVDASVLRVPSKSESREAQQFTRNHTVSLSPSSQSRGGKGQGRAEPPAHGWSERNGPGQRGVPLGEVSFPQPLTGGCLPGAMQPPLNEHLIGRKWPAPQGDQVTQCPWISASVAGAHRDASSARRM